MKILHVSHSDRLGGAAIAARRLHLALCAAGIDSRMAVIHRLGDEPTIDAPLGWGGRARTRGCRFFAKRIARSLSRGERGMQSLAVLPTGLGRVINESYADVVHLHWVGGEAMSLGEIGAIWKPLVWTLHDLWPLRGTAHVEEGPVRASSVIEVWTWHRKRRLWRALDIHAVCPSRWMAAEARRCDGGYIKDVTVIPNALDPQVFRPQDRGAARAELGLPVERRILLFGAQNAADDPIKGFDLLTEALRTLRAQPASHDISLAIYGADKGGDVAGFPSTWLGSLGSEAAVAQACAAADAFVAPSRMESFGNTVLEALFCGLPCAAFEIGGLRDTIVPGETGFLASPFEPESLAEAIMAALSMPEADRARIRERTLARFDPAEVVARHVDLYRRILADFSGSSVP